MLNLTDWLKSIITFRNKNEYKRFTLSSTYPYNKKYSFCGVVLVKSYNFFLFGSLMKVFKTKAGNYVFYHNIQMAFIRKVRVINTKDMSQEEIVEHLIRFFGRNRRTRSLCGKLDMLDVIFVE